MKPHHGHTFFEELTSIAQSCGALTDAFAETHLVEWPDDLESSAIITPAQERYNAIADEIVDRLMGEMTPQIEDAFVRIAKEVLERERRRQRTPRDVQK